MTRKDGVLDVWDYFSKQSSTSFSYKVSDVALSSVSFSGGASSNQLVAVGDESGTVSLLELSESLTVRQNNERQAMVGMFQREMLREKNLIAMEKETKKIRARNENRAKQLVSQETKASNEEQEMLLKIESDFLRLITEDSQGGDGEN